jgi:hypothetical protein
MVVDDGLHIVIPPWLAPGLLELVGWAAAGQQALAGSHDEGAVHSPLSLMRLKFVLNAALNLADSALGVDNFSLRPPQGAPLQTREAWVFTGEQLGNSQDPGFSTIGFLDPDFYRRRISS